MHPASVEVVGGVGEGDCDDETYSPGWDGEELGVYGFVAETGHDGRGEECEAALRDDVCYLAELLMGGGACGAMEGTYVGDVM